MGRPGRCPPHCYRGLGDRVQPPDFPAVVLDLIPKGFLEILVGFELLDLFPSLEASYAVWLIVGIVIRRKPGVFQSFRDRDSLGGVEIYHPL